MNKKRVVLISPFIFDRDAVGSAVIQMYQALAGASEFEVEILCRRCELNIPATRVDSISDLLLHPSFLFADIIIYFFAIYSPLFDAIPVGNGRALQIVRFHNITPVEFSSKENEQLIKRSFDQVANFYDCDEIWCDSEENRRTLLKIGLNDNKISVIPLSSAKSNRGALAGKAHDFFQIVYVGRFVPSKGILRMLEEFAFAKASIDRPVFLKLIGNAKLSDDYYIKSVHETIEQFKLHDSVEILNDIDDNELSKIYGESHVFLSGSYHEGFGMPVVEAIASGCIPVTYANSNLRYISNGLGRAVEDRTHALSEALVEVLNGLAIAYLDWESEVLPLDAGSMSLTTFDRATAAYTANFNPQVFSKRIYDRLISQNSNQ